MSDNQNVISNPSNRRSFLKTGLAAAGAAAAVGAGVLTRGTPAFAQAQSNSSSALTAGDAAILQFLAAGEILEADFWTQYNELGGIQDSEVPGGSGNRHYTEKLREIDPNFPQYIHDNTDDEISHANFINAYLVSRGAQAVSLEQFRTLEGSKATGSSGNPGRIGYATGKLPYNRLSGQVKATNWLVTAFSTSGKSPSHVADENRGYASSSMLGNTILPLWPSGESATS